MEYERVRKEAIDILPETYCPQCRFALVCSSYIHRAYAYTMEHCEGRQEIIDRILSLVEIRADDQSLPKGLTARLNLPELEHYIYGQEALDKAGFIRIIPKPKRK